MGLGSKLKKLANPIEFAKKTYDEAARLPGTWESISQNLGQMINGDISANPFGPEASGWDNAAGGDSLSSYPAARTVGRAIGSWFAGGAGGAIGKGALAAGGALGQLTSKDLAALMNGGGVNGGGSGMPGGPGGMPAPPSMLSAALRNRNPEELPKLFDPNFRPRAPLLTPEEQENG